MLYFTDRDILAAKERLQLEVARQRSTVQELRAHIDVLSEALTSARSSTIKYEEEVITIIIINFILNTDLQSITLDVWSSIKQYKLCIKINFGDVNSA